MRGHRVRRAGGVAGALAADLVARALFHFHGVKPNVDDLRFASQDSWNMPYGDHSTTNGSTAEVRQSIMTNHDGKSYHYDQNDDIDIAHSSSLNPGTGSQTQLVVFEPDEILSSEKEAYLKNSSTSSNVDIRYDDNNPPRLKMSVTDESGGSSNGTVSDAVAVGETCLAAQYFDRGASKHGTFGSRESKSSILGATAGLGLGDIAPDGDIHILEGNGIAGLHAIHNEWASKPQLEFLFQALLKDNVDLATLPTLQKFVNDGLTRSLPSYLVDAFGAGGPDFWWSADRHIRSVDGEGVVQLTNFAGSNFGVQRTAADQAIARGPSTRGLRLDHLEGTSQKYNAQGWPTDPTEMTVAAVVQVDSGSDNNALISASGSTAIIDFRVNSDDAINWIIRDSNSNDIFISQAGHDFTSGYAVLVCRWNKSAGESEAVLKEADGTNTSYTNTGTQDGSFQTTDPSYLNLSGATSWPFEGKLRTLLWQSTDIGTAACEQLRDDLWAQVAQA